MIVGCGYVGERLSRALAAAGADVLATTRSPARAAALPVAAAVADPYQPETIPFSAGDIVVDSVPADIERGEHLGRLAAAAGAAGVRRIIYLSATSVYGPGDGSWVDEGTPALGTGARARARLAEERALAASGVRGVSLRIAAIYGPGRGIHERVRAGTHRVYGDGASFLSRIHVDDLVAVIRAAGEAPEPGPVYVVGDDEPCTAREHADGVAAMLGLPPPPSIPLADAPPVAAEMFLSNRRIRNARMKAELGVRLRHPGWREGLAAILLDEGRRGV
ncbi:MAG TPA: NAD-dependent epimerase/dehydratase family protein [Haliangiales bacterium]|nr:NAD-dependent epimerase/dehydratase family protein [Haliangiales bacterium]